MKGDNKQWRFVKQNEVAVLLFLLKPCSYLIRVHALSSSEISVVITFEHVMCGCVSCWLWLSTVNESGYCATFSRFFAITCTTAQLLYLAKSTVDLS